MAINPTWSAEDIASKVCDDLVAKGKLKVKPPSVRSDRETALIDLFTRSGLNGVKLLSFTDRRALEVLVRKHTRGEVWVEQLIASLLALLPHQDGAAREMIDTHGAESHLTSQEAANHPSEDSFHQAKAASSRSALVRASDADELEGRLWDACDLKNPAGQAALKWLAEKVGWNMDELSEYLRDRPHLFELRCKNRRTTVRRVSVSLDSQVTWHHKCLSHFQQVIKEHLGRDWQAKPYGSAANGFGTESSDLDITIVLMQGARSDTPSTAVNDPLRVLLGSLPTRFLTIVEFVGKGKVPVLKLKYNGIHDVDITFNNQDALANTRLLRAYSRLDPKVKTLVIAVKEWAKNNKVHTQLPVLDGDKTAIDLAALSWPCTLSEEELFDHFLKFYAEEFKWGDEVVSVRLGKLLPATAVDFCDLSNCSSKRLHIEDPLLPQINLNRVLLFEDSLRSAFNRPAECTRLLNEGKSEIQLDMPSDSPKGFAQHIMEKYNVRAHTHISSAGTSITVRGSQSAVESCQQYAERCKRGNKIWMT